MRFMRFVVSNPLREGSAHRVFHHEEHEDHEGEDYSGYCTTKATKATKGVLMDELKRLD